MCVVCSEQYPRKDRGIQTSKWCWCCISFYSDSVLFRFLKGLESQSYQIFTDHWPHLSDTLSGNVGVCHQMYSSLTLSWSVSEGIIYGNTYMYKWTETRTRSMTPQYRFSDRVAFPCIMDWSRYIDAIFVWWTESRTEGRIDALHQIQTSD